MTERELFIAALKHDGPGARSVFLDQACGDDVELRRRVEVLLDEHEGLGSFLERPAAGLGATGPHAPPLAGISERPDTLIGPYKLLQQVGEGGMGTVWMAEQTHPVQRTVALKIIKPGMDTAQVVARFEAERQALALMDHPNIARVFDGGATAAGRPYFVMELVKGQSIIRYCDEHRLTTRQRLELFVPVCSAIQHAHQKGIIHRDVKPSNVLVTPYDGSPVVKVIDFGVAKATGQRLTERTLFTEFGAVVGTLEYMSPEQAELNNQDVDTRSDVYSLGVLLYELLTGTTPLSRERLKQAAFSEILRMIREEEPPKPSTRLSESKDSLASISAQRHTEPAKLTKLVRGELDWIVMKALEKDRNRRYETANGFAADVGRYLADEPVQACPPTVAYRLRKFVRRNKGAALAVTAVVLALSVGIVGTTWSAIVASRARTETQTESEAKDEAIKERDRINENLRDEKRQAQVLFSTDQLNRGLELCNKGEVDVGLIWLASALESAPDDDADLHRVLRANMANWGGRSSRLRAILPCAADQVIFAPDGGSIVSATTRETLRDAVRAQSDYHSETQVWDPATGKPVGVPLVSAGRQPSFTPLGVQFHKGAVLAPDGKRVLTVGDKTLQVWDIATRQPVGTALAHPESITNVVFSLDGRTLLTEGGSKTLRLWEVATGNLIGTRATSKAMTLAMAPTDGETVRTLSNVVETGTGKARHSASIHTWKAATGESIARPLDLPETVGVTAAAFSPNGRLVLTGCHDSKFRIWDAATGSLLGTSAFHEPTIDRILFSPDGKVVLTWGTQVGLSGSAPTAHFWYLNTGGGRVHLNAPMHLPADGGVNSARFSPDGRIVVIATVGSTDDTEGGAVQGTARLWDVATLRPIDRPLVHPSLVRGLVFSPDGRTLLTIAETVRLWDVPWGQSFPIWQKETVDAAFEKLSVPGTPRFRALYLPQPFLDLAARKQGVPLPLATVKDLVIDPQGKTVVTAFESAYAHNLAVLVQDADTGEPLGEPLMLKASDRVAIRPDGKAFVTVGADGTARVWETGTWKPIGPASREPARVHAIGTQIVDGVHVVHRPSVQWGHDNTIIMSTDVKGPLRWDTTSWQPVGPPLPGQGALLALSMDGRLLLTRTTTQAKSGGAEEAQLWDAKTGAALGLTFSHQSPITAAAFSADGRALVTGSEDRTARLWDVATGKSVGVPLLHRGKVTAMAFSPDGRTLVTGSGDGTVRFWDAATGRPIAPPLPHGQIAYVAFHPDGRTVVSATVRGHLCCWPVPALTPKGAPGLLAGWARSLGDREVDAAGVVGWQNAEVWNESRRRMEARIGPHLPRDDVLAWNRSEAARCSQAGLWYAATWHLDRLIPVEPRQPAHHAARGKARAHMGRFEGAAEDYSRAIELGENRREVRHERGKAYAALGEWEKAVADYAIPGGTEPPTHDSTEGACLYVLSGKKDDYRQLCRRMFGQVESAKTSSRRDLVPCYCTTRACTLSPDSPIDPARLEEMLVQAVGPGKRPVPNILACIHYRAGRFDQAVKSCEECLKFGPNNPDLCIERLVLAMACQRLGQPKEARQWLDKAIEWGDQVGLMGEAAPFLQPSLLGKWLEFQVLSREAKALIEAPPEKK